MLRIGFVVLVIVTILLESVQLLTLSLIGFDPNGCGSGNTSPIVNARCVLQGVATRYDIVPPLWAFFVASGGLLQPASVLRHLRPSLLAVRHDGDDSPLPFLVVRLAGLSAAMLTVAWIVIHTQSQSMSASIGLNFAWGCTGVLSGCAMAVRPESRPYGVYAVLTGAAVAGRNVFRMRQSSCVDPSLLYGQTAVALADNIDQVASVAESTATTLTMVGQDHGARRTLGNLRDILTSDEGIQKIRDAVSVTQNVLVGTTEYTDRALQHEQSINTYANAVESRVGELHTGAHEALARERDSIAEYNDVVETVASGVQKFHSTASGQPIPTDIDVTGFLPGAIAEANQLENSLREAATVVKPDDIATATDQLETRVDSANSAGARQRIAEGAARLHGAVDASTQPVVPKLVEVENSATSVLQTVQSVSERANAQLATIPMADGDPDPRLTAEGDAAEGDDEQSPDEDVAAEGRDPRSVKEMSNLPLSIAMIGSTLLMNPNPGDGTQVIDKISDYAVDQHGIPQLLAAVQPTFHELLVPHSATEISTAVGNAAGDALGDAAVEISNDLTTATNDYFDDGG